jgi:hypothetical protein
VNGNSISLPGVRHHTDACLLEREFHNSSVLFIRDNMQASTSLREAGGIQSLPLFGSRTRFEVSPPLKRQSSASLGRLAHFVAVPRIPLPSKSMECRTLGWGVHSNARHHLVCLIVHHHRRCNCETILSDEKPRYKFPCR